MYMYSMYVCMYACMHAWMYAPVSLFLIYIHIYKNLSLSLNIYIHVYTYKCTKRQKQMAIMFTHIDSHVYCLHIWVNTHTHSQLMHMLD